MATVIPAGQSRRSLLAATVAAATVSISTPSAAKFAAGVGLIDLELSRGALKGHDNVRLRTMTLWGTDHQAAVRQSARHRLRHADVMAVAIADTFARIAPDSVLSLVVASPIQQSGETQAIDIEQLMFAYDWMAAQGVRIVVQTFVGRNSQAFRRAYNHALERGLILVVSAGNGPDENPVPAFPAAYGGAISISSAALGAAFASEDRVLAANGSAISSRRSYVDFAVAPPPVSDYRADRDPDAAASLGSSRATAVAGGVLAGLSIRETIEGVDSARAVLSKYAAPGVPVWAAQGLLDVDRIAREASVRQRFGAA